MTNLKTGEFLILRSGVFAASRRMSCDSLMVRDARAALLTMRVWKVLIMKVRKVLILRV
jgi:hypothetical protein